MTPRRPIVFEKPVLRIGVLGDAGYRGNAQEEVLNMMKARHRDNRFDLIVHLGDTYFGGSEREVIRNLIDPLKGAFPEVRIIALCGNHDLYYGEAAHICIHAFDQPGRYVCVETPRWRILCLDTALGATPDPSK
jgi:predicted MPP superfamily phosphohydrolase